jgi:hypothetical protein
MQPPNRSKLHEIHEVTFVDSKNMTRYKKNKNRSPKNTQGKSHKLCHKQLALKFIKTYKT